MILIGDTHLKKTPEVYWKAVKKLWDWLVTNFSSETIIHVGDLVDQNPHGEVEDFIASYLVRFKSVHLLTGNHDLNQRTGNHILHLRNHPNIFIYEKETEVEIDGCKCLMLPFQQTMTHYNEVKWEGQYVFGHLTPEQYSFGNEFISLRDIKAMAIFNGHIHLTAVHNNLILPGPPLPTRNGEVKGVLYEITKKGYIEIELPDFFKIETVSYETDPITLNPDWLYNIIDAPDYNSVYDKFKGISIRERGIEIKRTDNTEPLDTVSKESLQDKWRKHCKEDNTSQEIVDCGLKYLGEHSHD